MKEKEKMVFEVALITMIFSLVVGITAGTFAGLWVEVIKNSNSFSKFVLIFTITTTLYSTFFGIIYLFESISIKEEKKSFFSHIKSEYGYIKIIGFWLFILLTSCIIFLGLDMKLMSI